MAQYEIRRYGKFWKGLSVIRVKAVPCVLPEPETFTREVLDICLSERFAIELNIIPPEKADDKHQLLLLLRRTSADRKELERKMELVPGIILRRIRTAGFSALLTDSDVYSDLQLDRFFSDTETGDLHGTGFYPLEKMLPGNAVVPFIPGSYSALLKEADSASGLPRGQKSHKQSVFQWKKLLECLVHYPYSLFAVQLVPTALTRAEEEWVTSAVNRLARAPEVLQQQMMTPLAALAILCSNKAFLVNIFVVGNESVNHDISYLMHEWGLESYPFLKGSFQNGNYLFNGTDLVSGAANVRAHAAQYRRSSNSILWGRLSRLCSPEIISAVLQPMESAGDFDDLQLALNPGRGNALPSELTGRENSVDLGYCVDDRQEIYLPLDSMTRHGCVVGKTGSGKTVFFLGLLHKLQQADPPIPFIVIEPVKTEYRCLKDVIPGLNILTPGNDALFPLELNPFIPPEGMTLGEYKQSLSQIFDISFSMTSLLQSMFSQAVEACYSKYGWRDNCDSGSEGVQLFGLHEFVRVFRQYTASHVDEKSSRNDVENSGVLRLQKLLSKDPVIFDTIRIPDYEKMLTEPTIIELDTITEDEQKMLVLTTLLINLQAVIRKRKDPGGKLRNLILIDEAHVVLNADDQLRDAQGAAPGAAGLKLLKNMTQVMRGFGTAMFFGDQSAAKLTKEIFSAADTKLAFRTNDPEDRKTIASSMLMTDEMANDIVNVGPGEGFFFSGSMRRPVLIQTPNAEQELKLRKAIPDEELQKSACSSIPPPYVQCARCAECANSDECDRLVRSNARAIAQGILQNSITLRKMLSATQGKTQDQSKLPSYLDHEFVEEGKKAAAAAGIPWTDRFAACVRIHMIRLLLLDGHCFLTEEQLEGKEPVTETGRPNPFFSIREDKTKEQQRNN